MKTHTCSKYEKIEKTAQIFIFQKYSKYFKSILLKVVSSSITSFFHSEECTVFRNITLIFLMGCIFFTVVHYNMSWRQMCIGLASS